LVAASALCGVALVVGACGGGGSASVQGNVLNPGAGDTVHVYSSLPLHGPARQHANAIVGGMKLALAEARGKAGSFKVSLRSLDDSRARGGAAEPRGGAAEARGGAADAMQTQTNARLAASDPLTVLYIGEWASRASELSIPILNVAGVPQLSPSNTYVGLTTSDPGSARGEPQRFYPTGLRTYWRIMPRETVEAAAGLLAMKHDGCAKVAVAHDRATFGASLAALLDSQKAKYGLDLVSNVPVDSSPASFHAYAEGVKRDGADCFYYAGADPRVAVQITSDVNAAVPSAAIYASSGVCDRTFANLGRRGVSSGAVAAKVQCTLPMLGLSSYPGGKQFLSAYQRRTGVSDPDPYAIYGYEAMKLGLDTIASLGAQGNDKTAVGKALSAVKARHSVLGTYGFDANGDTTLRTYGLYKIGKDGNPQFERALSVG
jgi:branched-chain amino acid transport system substrate-binding protein